MGPKRLVRIPDGVNHLVSLVVLWRCQLIHPTILSTAFLGSNSLANITSATSCHGEDTKGQNPFATFLGGQQWTCPGVVNRIWLELGTESGHELNSSNSDDGVTFNSIHPLVCLCSPRIETYKHSVNVLLDLWPEVWTEDPLLMSEGGKEAWDV